MQETLKQHDALLEGLSSAVEMQKQLLDVRLPDLEACELESAVKTEAIESDEESEKPLKTQSRNPAVWCARAPWRENSGNRRSTSRRATRAQVL